MICIDCVPLEEMELSTMISAQLETGTTSRAILNRPPHGQQIAPRRRQKKGISLAISFWNISRVFALSYTERIRGG